MRHVWMALLLSLAGMAQAFDEPKRGSADRSGMMDAIRPHAEWLLGAPVEFVVFDLRQSGDTGFANLWAQRPGGVEIDLSQTPMASRGGYDPDMSDGASIQVLYRKSGQTWVAVHWALGATDVWYADPEMCPDYKRVIPEICAK